MVCYFDNAVLVRGPKHAHCACSWWCQVICRHSVDKKKSDINFKVIGQSIILNPFSVMRHNSKRSTRSRDYRVTSKVDTSGGNWSKIDIWSITVWRLLPEMGSVWSNHDFSANTSYVTDAIITSKRSCNVVLAYQGWYRYVYGFASLLDQLPSGQISCGHMTTPESVLPNKKQIIMTQNVFNYFKKTHISVSNIWRYEFSSTLIQVMVWRQTITWTNVDVLSNRSIKTHCSEISIKIQKFSMKKIIFKMSSATFRPFCSALIVFVVTLCIAHNMLPQFPFPWTRGFVDPWPPYCYFIDHLPQI